MTDDELSLTRHDQQRPAEGAVAPVLMCPLRSFTQPSVPSLDYNKQLKKNQNQEKTQYKFNSRFKIQKTLLSITR